jgi:hypothetical protein
MNPNEDPHASLVEQALVSFDLAAEHHLANCPACERERERVQEVLREFGAANRQRASRPEHFWEQQAARIRAARSESGRRSGLGLTLTPGLAALLLLALAVLGRGPAPSSTSVRTATAQADADQQLLVRVERAVESNTPLALEPVTLKVEEDDGSVPLKATTEKREPRSHEN